MNKKPNTNQKESAPSEAVRVYHIGYDSDTTEQIPENLTIWPTAGDADWNAEEWVTLTASSEEEARAKYEAAFDAWQAKHEAECNEEAAQ